jgi:hypothetical protein
MAGLPRHGPFGRVRKALSPVDDSALYIFIFRSIPGRLTVASSLGRVRCQCTLRRLYCVGDRSCYPRGATKTRGERPPDGSSEV